MPQVGAFLAGAVGISATTVGAATAASAAFTFGASFVGKLIFSIAVSELSKALAPHPRAATTHAGVQGQSTASEDAPEDFMLGRFMTPGWISTPDRDHGTAGGVPNAYHTQVRELCGVPGAQLTRVALNGEWVTLGPDDGSGYGQPVQGKYAGYAWIKYYDGSQTVADPMLLTKYGGAAERPWTNTMIGHGLCYAIATFRINRDLFSTVPQVLYELQGIPLYDPRSDSTVGGTGAQRWSDSTTWAATDNPMVMCYNIARGITVGTEVWGGEYSADDLPLADWFTAMNACDATATNGGGSPQPMFRAGYMVSVDMQPADVMEALAATCSAEFADVGGVLKPRVGGPGLPVYYFTDDDVLATQPEDYQPFPGLDRTYNAVSANYPDPSTLYQSRGAPLRTDAAYQAADGGRLLAADLQLQACPYENQVQRLQTFLLKDNRRFRQHTVTLPPDATPLEPLDAAGWTSAENGYTSKTLEITATAEDQATLVTTLSLRERDGADYNWAGSDQIATTPAPALGMAVVPAQSLSGFAAAATTVDDAGAVARIPGLQISWAATGSDDIRAIRIEIRRQSDGTMINAIEVAPENASIIATQGIVAGITYETRGLILPYSGRATTWTGWVAVVAPTAVVTPSTNEVTTDTIAPNAATQDGTIDASISFTSADPDPYEVASVTIASIGGRPLLISAKGSLSFYQDPVPAVSNQSYIGLLVQIFQGATKIYESMTYSFSQSTSTQTWTFPPISIFGTSDAGSSAVSMKIRHYGGQNINYTFTGSLSLLEVKR
ncbi:hypothetical protein U879_02035 [Defluviimonas sp. 20V17]|nr:hypothetical protein U879_02035 [Defluviimonas sp. 20V17]